MFLFLLVAATLVSFVSLRAAEESSLEKNSRVDAQVSGPAQSGDDAEKSGLLAARYDIAPAQVLTGRGPVTVREAWLEKRPRPDVLAKLARTAPGLVTPHYVLCFSVDPIKDAAEELKEGAWFTAEVEWTATLGDSRNIMQLRLPVPPASTIAIHVIDMKDVKGSGKKIVIPRDKGWRTVFKLTKREPAP